MSEDKEEALKEKIFAICRESKTSIMDAYISLGDEVWLINEDEDDCCVGCGRLKILYHMAFVSTSSKYCFSCLETVKGDVPNKDDLRCLKIEFEAEEKNRALAEELKQKLFNLCQNEKYTLLEAYRSLEQGDIWQFLPSSIECNYCSTPSSFFMKLSPNRRDCTYCLEHVRDDDETILAHIQHVVDEFSEEAKTIAEERKVKDEIAEQEKQNTIVLCNLTDEISSARKARDITIALFDKKIGELTLKKDALLEWADFLSFNRVVNLQPYAFICDEIPAQVKKEDYDIEHSFVTRRAVTCVVEETTEVSQLKVSDWYWVDGEWKLNPETKGNIYLDSVLENLADFSACNGCDITTAFINDEGFHYQSTRRIDITIFRKKENSVVMRLPSS